jgi:hypothetical protein
MKTNLEFPVTREDNSGKHKKTHKNSKSKRREENKKDELFTNNFGTT